MSERETLGSRIGFILLSAGCAIGLGNVWRFPYITGQYGGAAFVIVYLIFLVSVGLPVLLMEFSIGRASRVNISGALRNLEPKGTRWHIYGPVAMAGNYLLMMYYTVVTGWLLFYFFSGIRGSLMSLDAKSSGAFFSSFTADPAWQTIFTFIAIITGFMICMKGLQKGVEKASKIMMGCLFILIVALAVNSMLLPGASKGLEFYLVPDFSKITDNGIFEVLYAAMGQSFFTLGLGIGSMEIFGSYIGKERSLTGEAVRVLSLDTFVALFAGLIIFPASFAFGVNPDSGPSLLFVTLPSVFSQMPGGRIWGALFFLFMSFAAMTTLIAVFENIIAYWIDCHGWTRKKASLVNMALILILSLPCILGFNLLSAVQPFGPGSTILDAEDFLVSSTITPIGSALIVLFCTSRYGWGWKGFINEADAGTGLKYPKKLRFYTAWVLPLLIIVIFLKGYWDKFAPILFG